MRSYRGSADDEAPLRAVTFNVGKEVAGDVLIVVCSRPVFREPDVAV